MQRRAYVAALSTVASTLLSGCGLRSSRYPERRDAFAAAVEDDEFGLAVRDLRPVDGDGFFGGDRWLLEYESDVGSDGVHVDFERHVEAVLPHYVEHAPEEDHAGLDVRAYDVDGDDPVFRFHIEAGWVRQVRFDRWSTHRLYVEVMDTVDVDGAGDGTGN